MPKQELTGTEDGGIIDPTMTLVTPSIDYTIRWETMAATLREQAAQFDFSLEDCRDALYWEIVNPLFEDAERIASSV